MEEILALRDSLVAGDIAGALAIVEEMEEMGLNAIRSKIRSHAKILLLHLIKQAAEERTTRSWDLLIQNAVQEILDENQRRPGSCYLQSDELKAILEKAYDLALKGAAIEAFGGLYDDRQLAQRVDRLAILHQALALIDPESEPQSPTGA